MKLLILNNLAAGYGEGSIYDFARTFAKSEDEIVFRCADTETDFASLLVDAKDFDAVVAAGGDGTATSVCYILRNTGVPILVFPSGTANLLAQNIWSPTEPHALAKLVRTGKTLDFDMGEMDFGDRRYGFSMMAGCGYDATIMRQAKADKKRLGPAAYFMAALTNTSPQMSHFTLDIDGKTIEHDGVCVLFMNFSKIQFDISIAKENQPRDSLLDVLVLTTKTAWDLLPPVMGAAIDHSGTPLESSDALKYYQGREIKVVADPPLGTQYDGEPLSATSPFTVRALRGATRLIVSDEGYREFE